MRELKSRGSIATALLVALFAFNAAPAPAHQDGMLRAVAAAVDGGSPAVPAEALDSALSRAMALTAIEVDATAQLTTVRLWLSGQPAYDIAQDAERGLLRITLADTIVIPDLQTMTLGSEQATRKVTAALVSTHPQFATAIEISLPAAAKVQVRPEKGALVVALAPAKSFELDAPGASPAAVAISRMREASIRLDAVLASDREAILSALNNARGQLAESELHLLQAELMEIVPTGTAFNAKALRLEFERHQTETALLVAGGESIAAHRADRLARLAASADAVPAFEREEAAYAAAVRTLRVKAEQQAELNFVLARRFDQICRSADPVPQQVSAKTTFELMDVAMAAMRSDPQAVPVKVNASKTEAVAATPVSVTAPERTAFAALSDGDSGVPPAPRARAESPELTVKAIARPEKMAVLRSGEEALAEAEGSGVIRLAQATTDEGITEATGARPATPVNGKASDHGPRRYSVPKTTGTRPAFNLYNPDMSPAEDPLRQLVNIDFRDMELSNVVALLAQKGQINVIAGTEVTGTVTANLKNIPLGRAIEIVLRMNGLGIVEEAGVYRITSYEEAIAAQRETRMIFLQNAQAPEVKETLDDILAGRSDGDLVAVSANPSTNVILLAGPLEAVEELEGVVAQLDVADPVIPTVTMPIKLNYSEPLAMLPVITPLVSEETGKVTADPRSRHLIVTDTPVKVQEIQALVTSLDLPVKQVSIEAMIVDAELDDDAATGVDWILNTVSTQTINGETQPDFSLGSALPITNPQVGAATMAFGVITDNINLRAQIQARVESTDSQLLANPVIVTVENQPATIRIADEIPYQELTQTSEGGQIASTQFKDVGTVLLVTPRVTHDNHILVTVDAKQSNTTGVSSTGVPIEAKREALTTLRVADGQSIYIGGLRAFDEEMSNRKVPVLGDIPVLNTFFKSQDVSKRHKELLIFLTCNVLPDTNYPELTPFQKEQFDKLGGMPRSVNGTRDLVRTYTHPEEMRDPIYKWRRAK